MKNNVYAGLTSEVTLYSTRLSFVGNNLIKFRVATGKYDTAENTMARFEEKE